MTKFWMLLPGFIASFSLVGCSKPSSPMQTYDWSAESGQAAPQLPSQNSASKVSINGDEIEISHQVLDGIEIADAYLKKQSRSGKALRLQGRIDRNEASRIKMVLWKRAQKNKNKFLGQILDNGKVPHVESFNLKIASENGQLQPRWYLQYSDRNGEMWEKVYSYELELLRTSRLGSSFDFVPAWVYPQGPKQSSISEVKLFDLARGENLTSSLLRVTTAADSRVEVTGQPLQYVTSDQRFDQVQAFFTAQKTLEWFQNRLGVEMSSPVDLQVHVGFPEKTNTAFSYEGRVRLGTGDDQVYSRLAWDPTVVTHEVSHVLVYVVAGLPFDGQGGSLNEGFADFFSAVINNNPRVGEASYLKGPFRRRIDVPKSRSELKGGLYGDSLIISSLLWEFVHQFGEKKGIDLAFGTLRGLTPGSQFDNFLQECEKVASSVLSTNELTKLEALLKERGWK